MGVILGDFEKDVTPLIPYMRAERVTYDNPADCKWLVAVDSVSGEVMGCAAVAFSKGAARFKSVYVLQKYRGEGLIYKFFDMADDLTRSRGKKKITGFFNGNSVHAAKKYGYVVKSVNKNGVAFAERLL